LPELQKTTVDLLFLKISRLFSISAKGILTAFGTGLLRKSSGVRTSTRSVSGFCTVSIKPCRLSKATVGAAHEKRNTSKKKLKIVFISKLFLTSDLWCRDFSGFNNSVISSSDFCKIPDSTGVQDAGCDHASVATCAMKIKMFLIRNVSCPFRNII